MSLFNLPIFREKLHLPRFFGGSVFSFLCCPIVCFYVLSSVLRCPLRFPHKKLCSVRLYLQLFSGGVQLRSLWWSSCVTKSSSGQHAWHDDLCTFTARSTLTLLCTPLYNKSNRYACITMSDVLTKNRDIYFILP
jgi:hypothetical protein